MGQCLLCNQMVNEEITLQELFSFHKKQEPEICRNCKESFIVLADQQTCPGCMRRQESKALCSDCREWRKIYPDWEGGHTAFYAYQDKITDWLHQYKFSGDYRLAAVFDSELKQYYQKNKRSVLFVPLPISERSFQERGFNQCEEMLKSAGLPYLSLLENCSEGKKQSEKNKAERMETKQPFYLQEKSRKYIDKSIILFDDVYTTGRTMHHARSLLAKNGYSCIRSLSISR